LPLTIAVTSVTTHSHPSVRVIMAAGIVTIGFFVGVAPTGNVPVAAIPSPISLFYGVFSSLAIAIHTVLIKSSLPYCNNSTIQLAYWTNAGSAILVAPFVLLLGEPVRILELSASPDWNMKVFVWGSLVTGLFGFLLCIAGLLSIKVTSPITHMFSSVRSCLIFTLLLSPTSLISYSPPLGCSLRNTDASGRLAISGHFNHVRHSHRPVISISRCEYCSNRVLSIMTILSGTMCVPTVDLSAVS
jgi:hypothetical protein